MGGRGMAVGGADLRFLLGIDLRNQEVEFLDELASMLGAALDKQIAAIALVNDLTLVTRNTPDFAGTGVKVINPFVRGQ